MDEKDLNNVLPTSIVFVIGNDMSRYKIETEADKILFKDFIETSQSSLGPDLIIANKEVNDNYTVFLTEQGVNKFEEYFPIRRKSLEKLSHIPQNTDLTYQNYCMEKPLKSNCISHNNLANIVNIKSHDESLLQQNMYNGSQSSSKSMNDEDLVGPRNVIINSTINVHGLPEKNKKTLDTLDYLRSHN